MSHVWLVDPSSVRRTGPFNRFWRYNPTTSYTVCVLRFAMYFQITGFCNWKESIHKHRDSAELKHNYNTTLKTFQILLAYIGTNKRKFVIYFVCTVCNIRTLIFFGAWLLRKSQSPHRWSRAPTTWKFAAMSRNIAIAFKRLYTDKGKVSFIFCRLYISIRGMKHAHENRGLRNATKVVYLREFNVPQSFIGLLQISSKSFTRLFWMPRTKTKRSEKNDIFGGSVGWLLASHRASPCSVPGQFICGGQPPPRQLRVPRAGSFLEGSILILMSPLL
jgi:hypothetical protein